MKNVLLVLFLSSSALFFICSPAGAGEALVPDIGVPGIAGSEEIPDWLVRWELARCLTILKRYDEAVLDYRLLLREKPELEKARLEMARALLWNNRQTEAAAALEKIEPGRLGTDEKIILADVYAALKKYHLARPLYGEVLEERPLDHKTRLKLAEMLSWDEQYDESLAEYRAILDAMPEDIQVRRRYAMVLIWSGNHEKAVVELRKTLK